MNERCAPRGLQASHSVQRRLIAMSHRAAFSPSDVKNTPASLNIYVSVQSIYFGFRMRPGARPARLDAVRSSLCLCLIVILHRVEAAGYEGGVYNGEWDQFL